MFRAVFVLVFLFAFFEVSFGLSIRDLFEALKSQPITKVDVMLKKSAEASYSKSRAMFYPKLYGLASYEHYNSPTSLRPTTPTESAEILREGGSLPFSKDIEQIGLSVSMPVFVYPLFSLTSMMERIKESAKERARLDFIKNEGAIVILNAKLGYLEKLMQALESTKKMLEAELSIVNVGVKNGRFPPVASVKIENMLNQIDVELNDLKTNRESVIATILSLTGVRLSSALNMEQVRDLNEEELFAAKPLEYQVEAQKYNVKAKIGKLYPSVYLSGTIFRKFGDSYNTDDRVIRNYGWVGLNLSVPIFDKVIYSDIEKAKSDYLKTQFELENLKQELKSESDSLNASLRIVKKSIKLAKKTVQYQKELLVYAKKAFEVKRMTEEEYLRYVDALVKAEADLYGLEAKRWEIISKLAVIYGNDLEELVR